MLYIAFIMSRPGLCGRNRYRCQVRRKWWNEGAKAVRLEDRRFLRSARQ